MEKIWYDPHEKSPRVDRILSKMSDLQTFELTQRVKAILQDKEKISPIPDIWRLRKQIWLGKQVQKCLIRHRALGT